MAWLYRIGKYVEWGCAGLIVGAMLLRSLHVVSNGVAGILVIVSFVAYWGVVLPRILHEADEE